MIRLMLVCVVFPFLMGADDNPSKEVKDEQSVLNGTWVLQSEWSHGKESKIHGPGKLMEGSVHIRNERWSEQVGSKHVVSQIVLDPTKSPKTVDLLIQGSGKVRSLAIYKIEGDILTVVRAESKETRPTSFKTEEGSKNTLDIYKRRK